MDLVIDFVAVYALLGLPPYDPSAADGVNAPNSRDPQVDLTPDEIKLIAPLLTQDKKGRLPSVQIVNGLLWLDRTKRALTHLPERYGSSEAIRKKSERWAVSGVWDRVLSKVESLGLSVERREALKRIAWTEAKRGKRIRRKRTR